MAKYSLDKSGKWVDGQGKRAVVQRTRDLNMGDQFEHVVDGKKATFQVVDQTVTEEGHFIVRSLEVKA